MPNFVVVSISILSPQCANLSLRIYLCLCLRPLQARFAISEASSAVMVLLKMKNTLAKDENLLQAVRRAYWCCYIIEAYVCTSPGSLVTLDYH